MSGILNNKSRVLDTVITTEGRRQLARGGINIKYVSFSDAGAFYRADIASGSQDATQRIYLESCQLPQDQITFKAGIDGFISTFQNDSSIQVTNGKIVDYRLTAASGSVLSGSMQTATTLSGSSFIASAETLFEASYENLRKMYVIASNDDLFDDDGFEMGPDAITYVITSDRPIKDETNQTANVNALDSVFSDPRFSRLLNFKYLPPVNKVADKTIDLRDSRQTSMYQLGSYRPWGLSEPDGLSYKQIATELKYYENLGYMRTIRFDPTSSDNRLVGQFFERGYDTLKKLDVIDYGKFATGDVAAPSAHVFFVGKVMLDDKGTDTFIHLFTLVFE